MDKTEIFKLYQLFELWDDLDSAEKLLSQFKGGYSGVFLSAEEFHKVLTEEISETEHDNYPDFGRICIWFAPASVWDEFVGSEGMELANRIYTRAKRWQDYKNKDKKHDEAISKSKISIVAFLKKLVKSL